MNLNLKKAMLLTMIGVTSVVFPLQSEAAKEDDELSIMAAEQRKDNDADVTVKEDVEVFDNRPPSMVNDNAKKNNNSNIKTDNKTKKNDDVKENNTPKTTPDVSTNTSVDVTDNQQNLNETLQVERQNTSDISIGKTGRSSSNAVVHYSSFEDAAKKVGYIPLYIPKKSGFSMNYIAVINDNIVEIHYGRRWEPTVTLSIRTYKRAADEQLKDISGINGVKWKVDLSSGSTIYIARISDKINAAAWSTGQYTFAAMTENFSFAAFHSLIVEELVDLCNHYFININK